MVLCAYLVLTRHKIPIRQSISYLVNQLWMEIYQPMSRFLHCWWSLLLHLFAFKYRTFDFLRLVSHGSTLWGVQWELKLQSGIVQIVIIVIKANEECMRSALKIRNQAHQLSSRQGYRWDLVMCLRWMKIRFCFGFYKSEPNSRGLTRNLWFHRSMVSRTFLGKPVLSFTVSSIRTMNWMTRWWMRMVRRVCSLLKYKQKFEIVRSSHSCQVIDL